MAVFYWYSWQMNSYIPFKVSLSGFSCVPKLDKALRLDSEVIFPFPAKLPVFSALVKAWNAGSGAVLAGPSASTIGSSLIVRRLVPEPVTKLLSVYISG